MELVKLGRGDYPRIRTLWQRAGLDIRPSGRDGEEALARGSLPQQTPQPRRLVPATGAASPGATSAASAVAAGNGLAVRTTRSKN